MMVIRSVEEKHRAVDYCQQGGIGVFYLPQGVWEGSSAYTVNTSNWPNGKDSLRDFSDLLWSKSMLLGIHTGSCSLKGSDPVYVRPIPDPRLASWGKGTLSASISSSDGTIYFIPDADTVIPTNTDKRHGIRPPVYQTIWGWEKIQIGNEVIKVGSYDDSGVPWVLSGCSRGQDGTSSSSHSSSDDVKGLLTVYNHLAVDPDSTLLQEVADKMSDLVNYCNIGRLSFDALETIECGGRWGMNKFMAKVYEGFDHYVATDSSSGLPQYEWYVASFANNGEPMHFYPKRYFEGYLIGGADENFVPEGLGAITFRKDSRNGGWHASTPDEWQWWLAKAAAYDATYWFWSSVDELDSNGQTGEILDICKKWERAKMMRVFTQAQREQMKDYDTTFRLTSSNAYDHNWQVTPTKVATDFAKADGSSISINNPYSNQSLRFEARVLPYYDHADSSNIELLPSGVGDFSIDSGLSVSQNGQEWTFTSSSSSPKQANWSIPVTDFSYHRGVGLWVNGNNQGGYFYAELSSGNQRHYIVPNDFTGWKYVEIPDFEMADYYYRDFLYNKFQNPYTTIRQGFRYHAIDTISFGITDVPSGNTASITIKQARAMSEKNEQLTDLQLSTGAGFLSVSGSVDSGDYIVYEGGSSVDVLGPNRNLVKSLAASTFGWTKPTGVSNVTVNCSSPNKPWLKVNFKTLGTPFNFPNPMDPDLDDSGVIGIEDFGLVAENWHKERVNLVGDLDLNGTVNFTDIAIMASRWLD